MRILLKSVAPGLLALLLLGNNVFCWAADQTLATVPTDIPTLGSPSTLETYQFKSGQAYMDPSSVELAPNISALHPQQSLLGKPEPNSQNDSEQRAVTNSQNTQQQKFALSAVAYDTAKQLAVIPVIDQLNELKIDGLVDQSAEIKQLQLKQKLNNSVLLASLQVRDVTARIEREIAYLNRILDYLQARRDKALRLNTIGTLVGVGAINEIGQAGEMKVNEIPGEITELVGGGITMLLGALSLRQQSGGKHQVQPKPNMLSKIFNRPVNKESDYPATVWSYLNRVPLDSSTNQTRLQTLFQRWRTYGIIGNKKGAPNSRRIGSLTNTNEKCMESIDLIGDQLALLSDIKAEIFQLDRDLLELLLNTQVL